MSDSFTAQAQGPAGCPLCGAQDAAPRLSVDAYTIVACNRCGLEYLAPMPTAEQLRAHYQQAAYFCGDAAQGYSDYHATERALTGFFSRRLRRLAQPPPPGRRLLDFGCASGYFLALARGQGWSIAGVELSAAMAASAATRLDTPIFTTLAEVGDTRFDAVTLWEVVEHLPDPLTTLRGLREHLVPGGVLALSTPNTGHWEARRRPSQWEGYRPPSHVTFLTAATLVELLARAGFVAIQVTRVAPRPPLPAWLERATTPLQSALATGTARPWLPALLTWRAIRVAALGWARLARRTDAPYATLEALAVNPP